MDFFVVFEKMPVYGSLNSYFSLCDKFLSNLNSYCNSELK
jgi:hypothetical protein